MLAFPESTRYIQLAEHDIRLLALISNQDRKQSGTLEDFSDWKVTIIFYISCILMKAVCSLWGEDIQNHYMLRRIINERPELYSIARDYRKLEEASRDARYEGRTFEPAFIVQRVIPKFNSIRDQVFLLLNNAGVACDINKFDIERILGN